MRTVIFTLCVQQFTLLFQPTTLCHDARQPILLSNLKSVLFFVILSALIPVLPHKTSPTVHYIQTSSHPIITTITSLSRLHLGVEVPPLLTASPHTRDIMIRVSVGPKRQNRSSLLCTKHESVIHRLTLKSYLLDL